MSNFVKADSAVLEWPVLRVQTDELSDFDGSAAAIQTHLESTKVFIYNFALSFFVPSNIRLGFKFFHISKFRVGLYLYLPPTVPTKELFGKHWCNVI